MENGSNLDEVGWFWAPCLFARRNVQHEDGRQKVRGHRDTRQNDIGKKDIVLSLTIYTI